jgi:fatty-acyl-CoA synthase
MTTLSYRHQGGDTALLGETIYPYLRRIADGSPDNEAVVSREQGIRWTYREFFEEIDRVARGLLAFGIEPGDRVAIWATNNAEWMVLQIATAEIGAVLVNINPAYRGAELEHALRSARVQTFFLMPAFRRSDYVGMLRRLCPELDSCDPHELETEKLPELRQVIVFDPVNANATERPAPGFLTWQEVLAMGETVPETRLGERLETLEMDDPINIQFTSGTTGFPKPVVLTHHNILNNGFFVGEVMRLTHEDRLCVPVPFYHCFGMVLANLACLTHGSTVVVPAPHFDAEATLATVQAERCTALHGVPTMFVAELGVADFDKYDLGSLRTGIMAGAPCPPEIMRKVMGVMGCSEILIAYGQTEASPVTQITRPDDAFDRRIESVGFNLPHQETKIVDSENGTIVPLGETGELCFRGYQVMRGYFELEEATRQAIDERGWLHSGDLGVMDEDGYVRITGRLKDMVIRGGENIYPAEIEAYLCTHPEVAQAAVFGIMDQKWGEDLGAWVQLEDGATVDPEELKAYVREGMAHFKVPRYVTIVDEFPMTVTGKIQKFKIREIVEEELGVTA